MKLLKNLLGFVPNSKLFNLPRTQQKGQSKFPDPPSSSSSSSSSSSETQFICEICTEAKLQNESFSSQGCSHGFCTDCIAKYISIKIQDHEITSISCPEPTCKVVLKPEFCRSILPAEVLDRWNQALTEFCIYGSHKFYCPYENCSAFLVVKKKKKKKKSECPHCNRLFCVKCKVPWHEGMKCSKFQRSKKNRMRRADTMAMELVKDRKWQRCPNCRFYVERISGCHFIRCRCGQAFCYIHGTLVLRDHQCKRCQAVKKIKMLSDIRDWVASETVRKWLCVP